MLAAGQVAVAEWINRAAMLVRDEDDREQALIGSVETLVEPDGVVLGDLDDAEFVLVEHGPTLEAAGCGGLVTRIRTIISGIRAGRRPRPAGELGRVLAQLETITQRRLPPPGRPRTS